MLPPLISLLTALGPAMGAAIVGTDRRIVRHLRAAGATSADRAVALGGRVLRRARTRRLTSAGALGATPDGRSWLDEQGWRDFRSARRLRVLIAVAIALAIVLAGLSLSRRYT